MMGKENFKSRLTKVNQEKEFISDCCKAEVERRGGKTDGSTFWFGCKKCKKDCDIIGKVMTREKEECPTCEGEGCMECSYDGWVWKINY